MKELWKKINQTNGYYEVSNLGRVKSWKLGNGRGKNSTPIILKPAPYDKYGHLLVRIKIKSKLSTIAIHKLVLETFVCKKPKGLECRHLNGIANDNNLKNLKWGTYQENRNDMKKHGTFARGSKNGMSKLTNKKIIQIRKLYKTGNISQSKLAEKFGMEQTSIGSIVRHETWTHI